MAHRHPRYLLIHARGIYLYMYVYTWGSLQFAIKMPFFLDMTAWVSCFPSEGAMFWDADARGLGKVELFRIQIGIW